MYITDPYGQLPALDIYEEAEFYKRWWWSYDSLSGHTFWALRANEELLKSYENALLNYCKLDTLAMVIIWEHWRVSLNFRGGSTKE